MNDQHVIAIATIVQGVLLFLNAVLIGWYLWETRKMRQAAEDQVHESQELVKASHDQLTVGQRQVEASLKQLEAAQKQLHVSQEQVTISQADAEAQISPALVVAISNEVAPNGTRLQRVLIRNVGSGPALNLRKYEVDGNAEVIWTGNSTPTWDLEGCFVPVQHSHADPAYPEDWRISRDGFTGDQRKVLHLVYQSLSGKDYASVIEFDVRGRPDKTRFIPRQVEKSTKVPCEAALHEAAHVIMFDALGMKAGRVCCVPPDPNFTGRGCFQLCEGITDPVVGIPGTLAGEVASRVFCRIYLSDAELQTDQDYFRGLTPEQRGGRSVPNFIHHLDSLRAGWVKDWIEQHREVIFRLATQIEAKGHLEGLDLQSAVTDAWGCFPRPSAGTMKISAQRELQKLGIPA